VTFTPGPASPGTSTISASPSSITADGSSTSTITVQAKDANGNNETTGVNTVTLATSAGNLSAVTNNKNGTYTARLTSTTTTGSPADVSGTITPRVIKGASVTDVGGRAIGALITSGDAFVTFTPGPASAATSTISASPSSITADGSSTSTITVQAKDANSNFETTGGDTVALATSAGNLSGVTDNKNGTYTARLTSATTAQSADVSATINSNAITSGNASVTFVASAPTIGTHASSTVAVAGAVTDTATLSGGHAPTGTVTFTLFGPGNATCSGTPAFTSTKPVTGDGGYTSGAFTTAAAGTYHWIAAYSGDGGNLATATICDDPDESVVVGEASTTTTLGSSHNPSTVGQTVSYTATASPAPDAGTVTFSDGAGVIAGCAAVSPDAYGKAGCRTTYPHPGAHAIAARYSGDSNYTPSSSPTLTQTIASLDTFTVGPLTPTASGGVNVQIWVSGPGTLTVRGATRSAQAMIATATARARARGTIVLHITPSPKARQLLATGQAVTITVKITYAPRRGLSSTRTITITFRNPFSVKHITVHPNGTVQLDITIPGPGQIDVLETAWQPSGPLGAGHTVLLTPGPHRFAFSRRHLNFGKPRIIHVTIHPNPHGLWVIAHHRRPVRINLWVTYQPTGTPPHTLGFFGLLLAP
jgi:adhesin/invasin